jgi:hypothetical protein
MKPVSDRLRQITGVSFDFKALWVVLPSIAKATIRGFAIPACLQNSNLYAISTSHECEPELQPGFGQKAYLMLIDRHSPEVVEMMAKVESG